MEHSLLHQSKLQGTSSRILYDIPCKVCQDHSSGKHYGIFACDGCAGFFKRSIRRNRQYVCKAKCEGSCLVDKTHRNQCRACRLRKCVEAGMNKDAVQHERGPRNSTLRRQMALYLKEGEVSSPSPILDLAMPKVAGEPLPRPPPPPHLPPPPFVPVPPHATKVPFFIGASTLPLTIDSEEVICESAARLLFMNVKWAKHVPAFTSLPLDDQLILLEQSWRELFVLGAAQFLPPFSLNPLLNGVDPSTSKGARVLQEVASFQESLAKLRSLAPDQHEYACLRAIVLFKTGLEGTDSDKRLHEAPTVAALQDHTQLMLNKYISTAHQSQPFRFGKLLLLLPALRAVSNSTIEELFFRRTIGHIPIQRIICDMYKTNDL